MAEEKQTNFSESELKALVKSVVTETLTSLGFDTNHPLDVQRDQLYLRDWRVTTESIRGKATLAAVGIVIVGLASVLWLGLKALIVR